VEGGTKVTLMQTGWKQGKEWDEAYEYLAGGNAQLLGNCCTDSKTARWTGPASRNRSKENRDGV